MTLEEYINFCIENGEEEFFDGVPEGYSPRYIFREAVIFGFKCALDLGETILIPPTVH